MYVSVDINFTSSYWGGRDDKVDFWSNFESKRLGRDDFDGEHHEGDPRLADKYERTFRAAFPKILENLVNEEIAKAFGSRTEDQDQRSRIVLPTIRLRLVTIEYSSIKPILDVIGMENSDLRDFVLLSLNIYAPQAFNMAMNSNVGLRASASALGDVPPVPVEPKSPSSLSNRSNDLASRAWMIANASLVVPVLLALLVLYFAFKDVSSEATDLKTERAKIVEAVTDQNKAISNAIVDLSKQAATNSKALQDALIAIFQDKTNGPKPVKP
ncbi:hypothetical protein [Bradyrhizobium sp. Gha]|uniref:hypothetical protein n=1 Tax=Bradyrhizobium sp. Gha TaxID=1855318 RepID=UPI0008DEFC0E|nr:hypothetical protein [Bradyrhizobium sp. Gha]SFK31167.1 hypothetical protein SAMN05216525_1931 [Bradyrhizobium sp. Gha]